MSSPLYLLRHPPDSLSLALYSRQDFQDPVLAIGQSAHSSSPVVTVVQSGEEGNLTLGKALSYKELLDVLLGHERVITL